MMLRVFPMSLTGDVSHWLRNEPAASIDTWETLKNKFLSKYYPPARTTKKMEGINNFQQELDETLYQASKRFKELLLRCPQHYLTNMHEVILFYKGLDVPTRQILDSKGAIPCMNVADEKKAIQEMANHSQKWHNGTSTRRRSTGTSDGLVGCESCKGPHYTKDCPLKEEVLQDRGSGSLPGSTETNPGDHVKSISTTIETDTTSIRRIGGDRYAINVLDSVTYGVFEEGRRMEDQVRRLMNEDPLPQKEKDPGRERMKLDLEARLMGEALKINRSQDPSFEDFIELNDLNTPVELRRNQVEDLGLTIGEGEVIDEPMIDIIKTRNNESFDEYPIFVTLTGRSILIVPTT
ncbi:hypothetical protein Tco_0502285 [Tanacetum coccineum]